MPQNEMFCEIRRKAENNMSQLLMEKIAKIETAKKLDSRNKKTLSKLKEMAVRGVKDYNDFNTERMERVFGKMPLSKKGGYNMSQLLMEKVATLLDSPIWNLRRRLYQNRDGSLTDIGKKKYLDGDGRMRPNKTINHSDYMHNRTLQIIGKQELPQDKKYKLTKNQKRYMDENGNLTLKGARATLPLGWDLSKYREGASKEIDNCSNAWKKYTQDGSNESLFAYLEAQTDMNAKLHEIDAENGRRMILKNIK